MRRINLRRYVRALEQGPLRRSRHGHQSLSQPQRAVAVAFHRPRPTFTHERMDRTQYLPGRVPAGPARDARGLGAGGLLGLGRRKSAPALRAYIGTLARAL